MKLIAMKDMQYRTRRLKAGDEFEAPTAHGRLFVAIKKAAEVREPKSIAPPPARIARKIETTIKKDTEPSAEHSGEMRGLRMEYQSVVGKRPSAKWDAETLKEKISAAKSNG